MSNDNFASIARNAATQGGWLHKTAVREGDRHCSFAELFDQAGRVASVLTAHAVMPKARVVLWLPESISFVASFLGTVQIGAVAVPISPALTLDQFLEQVAMACPDAIITDASQCTSVRERVACSVLSLEHLEQITPLREVCAVDRHDYAFGVFTSGTTGAPKICLHTHGDIACVQQVAGNAIGIDARDVCLSASGMHLAYGLGNALFFPLLAGSTSVLAPLSRRMTPEEALFLIDQHQVTVFSAIPSIFAKMLLAPHADHLSRLRRAITAGETLNAPLERRILEKVPGGLVNVFGTTELGHGVIINTAHDYRSARAGRVHPPYEIRVVDEAGNELAHGQRGALQVKGPSISIGVRDGRELPQRITDDWYATGDVAAILDDGYVEVLGRIDDMEVIGGVKVYPSEIETILMELDAISHVAVCGVTVSGAYQLASFIVLKQGHALTPDGVQHHLKGRLAEEMIPRLHFFVDALPYITGGKLSRRALRESADTYTAA